MCMHEKTKPGPRVPARWGSWATEVCTTCPAWRVTSHGPEPWRTDPIEDHLDDDEEL